MYSIAIMSNDPELITINARLYPFDTQNKNLSWFINVDGLDVNNCIVF